VKHRGSRRPASWRCDNITISKEEAIERLGAFEAQLRAAPPAELPALFAQLASTESDCGSAKNGGDLGDFGPGEMQAPFEAATFALKIGEMSSVVDTDSGVHLILRTG